VAKVKDILVHVVVEVAVRTRKCHRSAGKHGIRPGESCLVVREGLSRRNYCRECSVPILELAGSRVNQLQQAVNR
jgi:hypothetical protein